MIISASYRTDIPTFYGEWFHNRLRAGYCKVVNPYNSAIGRVSLARKDVDAFVFWTKNLGPFLPVLADVQERGYPFMVQYTINGYPRELESGVVDAARAVQHVRNVADDYGPLAAVWRYDTVVFSTLTPFDFHVENFSRLASELRGAVSEVVVSFAHLYRKTLHNMNDAAASRGFDWWDPAPDEKRQLVRHFVAAAAQHGISVSLCSQPEYVSEGATEARCVDARRLGQIIGMQLSVPLKGNRKACGCYESRDIGDYDTCPHGCVYCYAVRNTTLAKARFHAHNPESEFLFEPRSYNKSQTVMLPLFVDTESETE